MIRRKYSAIYALIFLAVFFSGLATGKLADDNMVTILHFELAIIFLCLVSLAPNRPLLIFFKQHLLVASMSAILLAVVLVVFSFSIAENSFILLALYACFSRDLHPYYELCKNNKILTALVILWLISISISFFGSPYDLLNSYLSRVRFEQIFVHVVCFISLLVFTRRSKMTLDKLLLAVSASVCLVGLYSINLYFSLSPVEISSATWKFAPPFSNNVRNLGYQVMVGLIVLLAYTAIVKQGKAGLLVVSLLFSAMVLLWGFLFWLGGRTSIFAAIIVVALLWLVLFLKGRPWWFFIKTSVLSSAVGIVLAEWFSVFPWNGLLQNVDRVVVATVQMQVPGRFNIWDTVWNAVQEHLLFGLGARAFAYIPYDGGWMTHPHNIFAQFLGEWGLVGSTLFLTILCVAFIRGYRLHIINFDANRSLRALVGGMVIVGLTVHALTDGTYYYAQPVFNLLMAFAIWVSPNYANSPNSKPSGESPQKDEGPRESSVKKTGK